MILVLYSNSLPTNRRKDHSFAEDLVALEVCLFALLFRLLSIFDILLFRLLRFLQPSFVIGSIWVTSKKPNMKLKMPKELFDNSCPLAQPRSPMQHAHHQYFDFLVFSSFLVYLSGSRIFLLGRRWHQIKWREDLRKLQRLAHWLLLLWRKFITVPLRPFAHCV